MSYTPPVTDRTAADVAAKNSKAYFNVAVFARIHSNTTLIRDLANLVYSISITLTAIVDPTTATIKRDADLNALIANINTVITTAGIPGIAALFAAWVGGSSVAPNYLSANDWEKAIDDAYLYLHARSDMFVYSGVGVCGASLIEQNDFVLLYA